MAKLKVDVSVRVTHCRPEWVWDVTSHAKLWQDLILVSFGLIKVCCWVRKCGVSRTHFYIYILFKSIAQHLAERVEDVETLTESLAERRQDLNPATAADLSVTFISATWEVSCIFRYFLILAGRFLSFYNPVFHSLVGTAHWRQITEQQSSACRQCERNHFTSSWQLHSRRSSYGQTGTDLGWHPSKSLNVVIATLHNK